MAKNIRTSGSDLASNFDFTDMVSEWKGYVSSVDKTNVAENIYVKGSQNIYKKLSGTLAVRQGQSRRGVANSTYSACSSEYVWHTSWGATYTMVVSDSTLWVVINDIWYPIMTGLTTTRFVFDSWWNNNTKGSELLFVNGTSNIYSWCGGTAFFASANNTAGYITSLNTTPTNGGSGYVVGDILTISGGTATATVTSVSGANSGAITSVSPVAGTGFVVGDVVTVHLYGGGGGTGGQLTVTSVDSNGTPLSYSIISGGSGYSNQYHYLTGGTGINGEILVNSIGGQAITGISLTTTGSGYTTGTGIATTGGTGTGATLNIVTVATGQITVQGTQTIQELGFDSTGSVTVGTVTFSYSSIIGTSFYGIGNDPTTPAFTVGTFIFQPIVTNANVPASNFNADFIRVINNQAYVGSYSSNLVYISDDTDYTNYTIPDPRVDGSPELIILGGNAKGIGVMNGNACIGYGQNGWAIVSFADQTVGTTLTSVTTVTNKPVALLQAPLAHEFIDMVGDNLIYLSQDQQVREFGNFNDAFVTVFPSLSQEVATELMNEDFTGGQLRCIGEFIYLTSPTSGKVYLRQERTSVSGLGVVVSEKLWHSPFTWNATRIDQIDGDVVVFSNSNPQIYSVWDTGQWFDDSPSDEQIPYECILALGYRGEGRRQGLFSFDKNFTEGYMSLGTPLMLQMNYNYQGATLIQNVPINSQNQPAYFFQTAVASLGDNSLGDESLGDGGIGNLGDDMDFTLPKFKVISPLPIINCFEWQPIFYTNDVNAQWEILATGTNAEIEPDQMPTFIINKKPIPVV